MLQDPLPPPPYLFLVPALFLLAPPSLFLFLFPCVRLQLVGGALGTRLQRAVASPFKTASATR